MSKPTDLATYLFAWGPHLLSGDLLQWMEASPRFAAFVETYRDKIRKKVRIARDAEGALDLRSELLAAYRLLSDRHQARRLEVAYEPYASEKRRGPDFAVTYRDNLVFNLEVARIRADEDSPGEIDLARKEERFLRILLDKLGQMQPGMANLLAVHTREELARTFDLDRLMREVKTRAEGKDPAFYALSQYTSPAGFFKDFHRLSGVLLWADGSQLWANKGARPALEGKVLRLVGSLLSGP